MHYDFIASSCGDVVLTLSNNHSHKDYQQQIISKMIFYLLFLLSTAEASTLRGATEAARKKALSLSPTLDILVWSVAEWSNDVLQGF
jgi:hypothetical protein